jgi:phosphoglycolate phosphatase
MAVLTNKPVIPSREICRAFGIAPFFFQNYGGNSFETKKPDPGGLLTLMEEATSLLGGEGPLLADQVVMIGDSDVDVLTARRCGVRSLGCTFGPDSTVDHPLEWPEALGL